jgi:hypothetical protein
MTHLPKTTRTARVLLFMAALAGATGASPVAWALDNPPPGPTIDVDCTDPDQAQTCRECHVDGPIFCCPEAPDPCTIKKPAPVFQLPTPPTRRGLGSRRYFTR